MGAGAGGAGPGLFQEGVDNWAGVLGHDASSREDIPVLFCSIHESVT